ncbi:MAG: hypothetical protein WD894_09475 [Pirellulales bacterium]
MFSIVRTAITVVASLCIGLSLYAREGQLELSAIDRDTGKPIAVRVHLQNVTTKKPVKPPGVPALDDHFVFYDKVKLKLPLGNYRFVMERGPEYLTRTGHFTINNYADDRKTVDMKRFVDMAAEGWYAGDLDVHRRETEIELLMRAEDLYIATLGASGRTDKAGANHTATQFDGTRFYALRDVNGDPPLPFSWDLPLGVAGGKLESVQIAHRHLLRYGMVNHKAGGRPRDLAVYPGVLGNGVWSLDIYYHLLNCSLRLPPTAGSGSGWQREATALRGNGPAAKAALRNNFNPVGYNRVYVFIEGEPSWEKWWEGLRTGRAMVTNGPLIRPSVEGQPPGHVFHAEQGQTVELEIGLSLSTRDQISYLEVVKNGATAHSARLDKWKASGGKLPSLKFTESGWFLIRAVADDPSTYRFATTAPYYVQIGDRLRISRASAQFFVNWCSDRVKAPERDESLADWRRAEAYWTGLLNRANAP